MKAKELKTGVEYIFKSNYLSRYPIIEKGLVVDKTKTTIKIKFESGSEKRLETAYFENEYIILEEIKNHE